MEKCKAYYIVEYQSIDAELYSYMTKDSYTSKEREVEGIYNRNLETPAETIINQDHRKSLFHRAN